LIEAGSKKLVFDCGRGCPIRLQQKGGGRRPAFTGPATQPYSATEADGWQQLSRVSQNRAAVHKWLFSEGDYGMTSLPLLALTLVWGVLRLVELNEDPRKAYLLPCYFTHILIIVRYLALVFLHGFAALLVNPEPTNSPDPTFAMRLGSTNPSTLDVSLLLLGALFVFLLLQHMATSLKLEVQFQEVSAVLGFEADSLCRRAAAPVMAQHWRTRQHTDNSVGALGVVRRRQAPALPRPLWWCVGHLP
jgi:hypothetical protein